MLDRLDETIVAISSAPGHGPLGIVRLSGGKALEIADRLARLRGGEPLRNRPGFRCVAGEVLLDADALLPARFLVFRKPRSYTREDLVEIQSIGSPAVLELIRRRAIEMGAVPAEPGEFTARAFLHGAMTLPEAEAVAGLICAQSDTQLRASRRMLDGAFARRILEARGQLAELVALVEADIDFAEEPIEFITPPALCRRLDEIAQGLRRLLTDATPVERLDALPRILLFGAPNVGKSSLMNRLSGTERSICAAAAGTTRDILAAPMRFGRGEAILLDTAGVDASLDEVIAAARAATLCEAERVDLVCVVADATRPVGTEAIRALDVARTVVAANKVDLLNREAIDQAVDAWRRQGLGPVCPVSAVTGEGVEDLRRVLSAAVGEAETTTLTEAVVLTERQAKGVSEANEAIQRALALADQAGETVDCADLLAFELREALDALGAVVGEVTTEDLLGQVFARFCIGK
jgi:tRNA modification GTPase